MLDIIPFRLILWQTLLFVMVASSFIVKMVRTICFTITVFIKMALFYYKNNGNKTVGITVSKIIIMLITFKLITLF